MKKWEGYMELNPSVMMGKPIIKGTRITVKTIIDEPASGYTEKDILKAHRRLKREHILTALQYAGHDY